MKLYIETGKFKHWIEKAPVVSVGTPIAADSPKPTNHQNSAPNKIEIQSNSVNILPAAKTELSRLGITLKPNESGGQIVEFSKDKNYTIKITDSK